MANARIFFWGHTPSKKDVWNKHVFSNWHPCEFIEPATGQKYLSTEQYMMAKKAELFGDTAILERVLVSTDQREIKALGREIKGFDEATWLEHRFPIVRSGNYLKFSQNQELRATLLKTAGQMLVEAAPNDAIWGIGLSAKDAEQMPAAEWPGLNLLGKALMEVREMLIGEDGMGSS
eukprot:NODE_5440_length_676_cov_15.993620_g5065_i0.p2 GENE.NODE_5440_length_676_cov_15.993620_g5065_i0~~NODE_5440_length_676_cov_15.993620_g5065_i0.p2  ORF type:complete len:187 (+),score=42.46 NODE_5440_length_676_cov_15.993620_g5065_i0:31-561(+)